MEKASHQKSGGSGIWTTLLSDTAKSVNSSLSTDKSVIVFGNDLSGKSVLAAKLQGTDKSHRGSALDFQAMEVQDEDKDEFGFCRVWIVDGHLAYRSLLEFALPKPMVPESLAIIAVDMSQPWNIPDSLQKWMGVLKQHVKDLGIPAEQLNLLKQKLVTTFQTYTDPTENAVPSRIQSSLSDSANVDRQLDEMTLCENLGIPIVVVCTKCDCMESIEMEFDYKEDHFDFIQYYLRQFCLRFGAALVYTSIKENKNIDLLKKYILHTLYGFPMVNTASVVDRDAVFIPAGWDSESKINILKDNFSKFSGSDPFESVIGRPMLTRMYVQDLKEVSADDEQVFLTKAQEHLAKAVAASKLTPGSAPPKPHSGITPVPNVAGVQKSLKPDSGKAGPNNERMLATFFQSLLNKKPAAGTSPKLVKTPQKGRPSPSSSSTS